jgi:hypothetical protein
MALVPLGDGANPFSLGPQPTELGPAAVSFEGVQQPLAAKQEDNRLIIAVIIVSSLAAIVAIPFLIVLIKSCNIDDLIKLVQATIGPVIGVVGAVTGFYFGTRESGGKQDG